MEKKTLRRTLAAYAVALTIAALVGSGYVATAITSFPPGSLLQPNDVTSGHIRDGTIVNVDVSSTAAITYGKLNFQAMIANADVSSTAAIADTKLATITTAGKVDGSAITNLANVPAGAGVLPTANVPTAEVKATSTAGEPLATSSAVYPGNGTTTNFIAYKDVSTNNIGLGNQTAETADAVFFTPTSSVAIGYVRIDLKKVGSPVDNVIIGIESDNSNSPSGTYLASTTIGGASLTTSYVKYTFEFTTPAQLTGGSKYWATYRRSGAVDGVNYYQIEGPGDGGNNCFQYNGTSWSQLGTNSCDRMIFQASQVGKVYNVHAFSSSTTSKYVGVSKQTYAAGAEATIYVGGAAHLGGFTPGTVYYASNHGGALATSAGAVERRVGVAISTSTLIISGP